jgi:UDP-N-acetyl-2-amino-2-deoxyglucuronate dehydrogenase
MYNFAITGVAGYVAPRHLKAIKDTHNRLVAAVDPHDSVGILDKYFPNASFFTEFERFDRHLEKLRRTSGDNRVQFLSICSPNHLHDAHIRLALRIGANAICEKPLVINPWNLDALQELEVETGCRINTVLQLRVHPALIDLKKTIQDRYKDRRANVKLTYITSRGLWYNYSWKGNIEKSGGVVANIGIHFFDMLIWLFGSVKNNIVHLYENDRVSGFIELEKADIQWFLSIDKNDLPAGPDSEEKTFRSIEVDGKEINFSSGFTDLHTKVYEETIAGNGFGIKEARPSILFVHQIRTAKISPVSDNIHPIAGKYKN